MKIIRINKQYLKFKKIISFYVLFFATSLLLAQNAPVTTISSVTNAIPGASNVPVTVKVNGFSNICQFTLTIKFDTTKIHFVSATPNLLLSGMNINYTSPSTNTTGMLIMTWSAASNISLPDSSILANLNFSYISSTGILSWAYTYGAVCQYKTFVGSTLTSLIDSPKYMYYINGGISDRAAPVTYAPNILNPNAGSVQIPITVNNFSSIGAITLYLEYDTTVITYQNSFSKNTAFNSSFLVGNIAGNGTKKMIVIQWYGTAVNLSNGATLCTFNFNYLTGGNNTTLNWFDNGPSCEYADGSGNVLIDKPAINYYVNGTVGTGIKLKGQLLYDNATSTPLNGASIQLLNGSNTVIATTTTYTYIDNSIPANPVTLNGYYNFNNLSNGNTYKLRVLPSTSWGGVNSTDALLIKKHTVGLVNLTGLPIKAADVNLSSTVNSTDALLLQLRSIGYISQFNSGDWVYGDTVVSIQGNTTHNISVLAAGDVNQSYIPGSKKGIIYSGFQKEGIMFTSLNQQINLAVSVNEEIQPAAMSLNIKFDQNKLEIIDLKSEVLKDLKYNIIDDVIYISWVDINAVKRYKGDILFNIIAKVKAEIKSTEDIFRLAPGSEFADAFCNIINMPALNVNAIETNYNTANLKIYPNPLINTGKISYEIPFEGEVSLELINNLGIHLNTLINEYQTTGKHNCNIDANNYKSGIYILKLNVKNTKNTFSSTIKLIIK